MRRRSVAPWLALSLALGMALAPQARAQTLGGLLQEPGSAGLGFVMRMETSPYVDGGHRTDLLPLYLYEGERFFLDAGRAGFKLRDHEGQRLDLFLGRRLEGFPEDKVPAVLAGMDARNTSVDLGFAWHYRQRRGALRATLTYDVGGASDGAELVLAYSRDWHRGRWLLRPELSLAWRNGRLNDYYHGVRPHEATATRPAYAPGSGLNTSLGLFASYRMLDNWRLLGGVSVTSLDRDVRNSPIVADRLQVAGFIGAAYDFGTPAARWGDDGVPLIVKLFHGGASAEGCHLAHIMTLRCASLDRDDPSSVTGLHVGRPFLERVNGWPVDIHGYVGVLRRNERGRQPGAWQVDAYMKAFFYGFPWSARVETRLGFGIGLSYASRVPWHEVDSQARRGRPTSKLLNYLDPSIDVNVGDLLGSDRWRRTYVGVGVSHRSGIFASSRLLGRVNGGSNYLYTYLETEF